eukprot:sb/3475284/
MEDITGGCLPSVELSLSVLSVVTAVVVVFGTIGRVVLGLVARFEYRATKSSRVVPVLLLLAEEVDSWSTIVTSSAVVFDIAPPRWKRVRRGKEERRGQSGRAREIEGGREQEGEIRFMFLVTRQKRST